jgi:broad specificity phosphatase PhoE
MTTIILVRHGQTAWNREERFRGQADIPLNDIGIEQARKTAERIQKNFKPSAVYSSPLGRAMKTAEIIAEIMGIRAIQHKDLLDIDYGKLKGLNREEAHSIWPEVMHQWLANPDQVHFPDGESLDAVKKRAENFLAFISSKHPGETVVAVGHTVINRVMLLKILSLENNHMWDLEQDNCAINLLEQRENRWRVISMNETGHL